MDVKVIPLEKGEKVVVGINKFIERKETKSELLEIDPIIGEKQAQKLKLLKENRDKSKVKNILAAITNAARKEKILMPLFVEAAENKATLGEMADALREVFGEYDRN